MGISGFLMSSQFIDGGVTGISMLLAHIFGYPISTLLVVINVPFIILGYHKLGWKFALKTTLAIVALAPVGAPPTVGGVGVSGRARSFRQARLGRPIRSWSKVR